MVAKVSTGKTIRGVLSYNENKVKEGTAFCLAAEGFLREVSQLTFHDKLQTFLYYQSKNVKAKTNSVHISLNFDREDRINSDRLSAIASSYLNRIGFNDQPFLVYQHLDAAHPHIHIVTTNIRIDGSRIDLHNIGRNQSEKARKEVESEFGLVKAEGRKRSTTLNPVEISKAVYGKSETKRAISNIVNAITKTYKFTSIHELNAVLKQYNVMADRGVEGTRMWENNGLLYSLIDSAGNPVGVPIKSSSIYGKPTLTNLMKMFAINETSRMPYKDRVRTAIDGIGLNQKLSLSELATHLALDNIYTVIRQNSEGRVYGITFIDNQTKCVFNGSDLGKQYSAQRLIDRLNQIQTDKPLKVPSFPVKEESFKTQPEISEAQTEAAEQWDLIRELTSPRMDHSPVPYELRKRKRKKGKRI